MTIIYDLPDLTGAQMDPDTEPTSDTEREPTAEEMAQRHRRVAFISAEEATPEEYPAVTNISAVLVRRR